MVAGNPALQAKVLFKVAAHALAEELFPTIAIFRQRRVGVFFLESNDIGSFLFVTVVDTS